MSHSLIADLIRDRDRLQARCAELEKALREIPENLKRAEDDYSKDCNTNAPIMANGIKYARLRAQAIIARALHEKGRDG